MYGRPASWQPQYIPPAPCDTCPKALRCAREKLACVSFSEYVSDGEPAQASTNPTSEIYKRLFSGEENE